MFHQWKRYRTYSSKGPHMNCSWWCPPCHPPTWQPPSTIHPQSCSMSVCFKCARSCQVLYGEMLCMQHCVCLRDCSLITLPLDGWLGSALTVRWFYYRIKNMLFSFNFLVPSTSILQNQILFLHSKYLQPAVMEFAVAPPVMFRTILVARSMPTSSNGDWIALSAASRALDLLVKQNIS